MVVWEEEPEKEECWDQGNREVSEFTCLYLECWYEDDYWDYWHNNRSAHCVWSLHCGIQDTYGLKYDHLGKLFYKRVRLFYVLWNSEKVKTGWLTVHKVMVIIKLLFREQLFLGHRCSPEYSALSGGPSVNFPHAAQGLRSARGFLQQSSYPAFSSPKWNTHFRFATTMV